MDNQFVNFLIKAKKSTYASAEGDSKKVLSDGSKEFVYKEGTYFYRDRYFGSDPFAGQEVVFSNGKAIWVMNYCGHILDRENREKEIYNFLKRALMEISEAQPFRGPSEFILGNFKYTSKSIGTINSFEGVEVIYSKNNKIYKLSFHGGLIS